MAQANDDIVSEEVTTEVTEPTPTTEPSNVEATKQTGPPAPNLSLVYQLREVRNTSSSCINFFVNFVILLIGTCACGVAVVVTYVIPGSMVVIGMVFYKDCPNNRFIPVFLMVGGVLWMLQNIVLMVYREEKNRNQTEEIEETEQKEIRFKPQSSLSVITALLVGWFIIGTVVMMLTQSEPTSGNCKYMHTYTMYIIVFVHILLAFCTFCLLCSCISVLMCCRKSHKGQNIV